MKIPVFDSVGRVWLWLLKNGRLIDLYGNSIGFVEGDSVYDYNGFHRGWFERGFIRDHSGACVCFVKGARDISPILPITQIPPIPPIATIEPIRPIKQIKPIKSIKQLAWSIYTPISLFGI